MAITSNFDSITSNFRQASWRGISFEVREIAFSPMRQTVVKVYPYRDYPTVEDMGRAPGVVQVRGYMGGDPAEIGSVYLDEPEMIAACNKLYGPGMLVHPSLGSLAASCVRASMSHAYERLGVIEVSFEFILIDPANNPNTFNTTTIDTQATLQGYASNAQFAIGQNHVLNIQRTSASGFSVMPGVLETIRQFVGLVHDGVGFEPGSVTAIATDASAIVNSTRGLGYVLGSSVTLGQYSNGNLTQAPLVLTALPAGLTVAQVTEQGTILMVSQTTVARAAIIADAGVLIEAATDVTVRPDGVANAMTQVMDDLTASTNDPVDQLRVFAAQAGFQPTSLLPGAKETGDLIRCMSLVAMAKTISNYQPTSSTDAESVLLLALPLFDAQIALMADDNDLLSYQALRQLRAAVVTDMQSRGSTLPPLIQMEFPPTLPAAFIAQLAYQNAKRTDEIVIRNNPIHPLFLPAKLEMLSF